MSDAARDRGVAAALFAATLLYLWFWPRELNGFDESLYLYEAKRVYEGAVMYRDFFDLITPAWFYLMAAMYALFGVDIETARAVMAVNHALITLLIFTLARRVGVRRLVATALAMTHLTLAYPGCPIATPHWLSTLLTLLLLLMLWRWPAPAMWRAFACGLMGGLLTVVQQQKGVLMVAAGAAVLVADAALGSPRAPINMLARRLSAYTAGVLAVSLAVLVPFIVAAGFDEVFRATVRVPLVNYPAMVGEQVPWGGYWPGNIPHGYIIKYLPLIIPATALWLVWRWWSARVAEREPVVLLIYAAFALWSIWYLPDHLHLSYVAPVWFVLAASVGVRLVPPAWQRSGSVVAVALIVAAGWQLLDTIQRARARCGYQMVTPFGRLDTSNPQAQDVYDWLTELFRGRNATHVFVFPTSPIVWLLTGTDNPTRYQILQPRYSDAEQLAEVVADLERHRTPFIVRNFYVAPKTMGVLNSYIDRHYEKLAVPPSFQSSNYIGVYARRGDGRRSALF